MEYQSQKKGQIELGNVTFCHFNLAENTFK